MDFNSNLKKRVPSCSLTDKLAWWVTFDIGKLSMKISRHNDAVFNAMSVWFSWSPVVYFDWCQRRIIHPLVLSYNICNTNPNVGDTCKIIKLLKWFNDFPLVQTSYLSILSFMAWHYENLEWIWSKKKTIPT